MFDWRELLNQVSELVRDHLLKALIVPLIAALAGVWTWWLARRQMRRRAFMRRVNATLNLVESIDPDQNPPAYRLRIRTIFEMDIDGILLGNKAAVRLVLDAAKHTDTDHPFLSFDDADDQWLVLNAVLNELSERFAAGLIAQAAGLPTRSQKFLFGITCEKHGSVRIQKIRIMLISEPMLQLVHDWSRSATQPPRVEPVYESPNHSVRWLTLQAMAKLHVEQQSKAIRSIELIVPA
jgi:hypothetical protein